MKKLILSLAVISALVISSCGPNAEEVAKKAQARMDSIAKVTEDSLMAVEAEKAKIMQDSINAAMEKMKADSIAMAEEAAAKKKGSKPKAKKEEPKKANGTNVSGAAGRGGSAEQVNKTGASGRK